MLPTLITILAETEAPAPLIMPAWIFPLLAAIFFVVAGFVVWSYRDVAHRHDEKLTGAGAEGHDAGHGH
jgi:hypothetical protein